MNTKPRRTPVPRAQQHAKVVVRLEAPQEESSSLSEYSYVIADLKRVGLTAAGMFALLIALSFLIR